MLYGVGEWLRSCIDGNKWKHLNFQDANRIILPDLLSGLVIRDIRGWQRAARCVVLESGVSRMMVWKSLAKRQEILSYDAKRINKFEL